MLKFALLLSKILIYLSFAGAFLLESTASELTSSVGPQVQPSFVMKGVKSVEKQPYTPSEGEIQQPVLLICLFVLSQFSSPSDASLSFYLMK